MRLLEFLKTAQKLGECLPQHLVFSLLATVAGFGFGLLQS